MSIGAFFFLKLFYSRPFLQLQLNMLQVLPSELQDLYQYLEVEFNPLHLCERVMPILEGLEKQDNLQQYVELLKHITLARLIKQVKGFQNINCFGDDK